MHLTQAFIFTLCISGTYLQSTSSVANILTGCSFPTASEIDKNSCLTDALIEARRLIDPQKIGKMGSVSLDSIPVNDLFLREKSGQINFETKLTNVNAEGANLFDIVSGRIDYAAKKIRMEHFLPEMLLTGFYSLTGNLLLLPLNGDGDVVVHPKHIPATFEFDFDVQNVNGKKKIIILGATLKISIKSWEIQLTNVDVGGDPTLTESLIHFLNSNIKLLLPQVQPVLEKDIGDAVKRYYELILNEVPGELLYP